MSNTIVIGISNSTTRFEFYPRWVLGNDLHLQIVLLAAHLSTEHLLSTCDALVLTGGTDLHPASYQSNRLDYPHAPKDGWDEPRDYFEQNLFRKAMELQIPVLAICRGLQLVNVTMGGSLIPDVEEAGKNNHRRSEMGDRVHSIQITPGTQLFALAGTQETIINSAHHQAVDRLADDLMISALSEDHVIEALEWKEREKNTPLLAVQWHPERTDSSHSESLSSAIRNWLLQQARLHHAQKNIQ